MAAGREMTFPHCNLATSDLKVKQRQEKETFDKD